MGFGDYRSPLDSRDKPFAVFPVKKERTRNREGPPSKLVMKSLVIHEYKNFCIKRYSSLATIIQEFVRKFISCLHSDSPAIGKTSASPLRTQKKCNKIRTYRRLESLSRIECGKKCGNVEIFIL